jgi:alpha-tubulin suppressor-like RCC1 family protein
VHADGTASASGDPLDGRTAVGAWRNLVAVSAGSRHTVGLISVSGVVTAVATGANDFGQCDVSGWTQLVAVAAGGRHTVGLRRDGTVVACGDDSAGQTDVSSWTNIVAIAAGPWNTVGIRLDGTAVLAGATDQGQGAVDGWTDLVAVSVGDGHVLGLRADGSVLSAGRGEEGQGQVAGWGGVVAVSAAGRHSVALRWDGTVLAAGDNADGEKAATDWTSAIAIAAGSRFTVAVQDGKDVANTANYGRLLGVGDDARGQVDLSPLTSVTMRSSAFTLGIGQVFDLSWSALPVDAFAGDVDFSSGNATVASVDGTGRVTAKAAGTVDIAVRSRAYGLSAAVRVTVVASAPALSPRARPNPATDALVSLTTDPAGPAQLSAGRDHLLVLYADGRLEATGRSRYEETGVAALSAGPSALFSVSAGSWHSAAVHKDGTVTDSCSGTLFACGASSWTGIAALASAPGFLVGLKADGTARSTPSGPDVSGWSGLLAVAAGGRHALGLKSDRTVVAAGSNDRGQTGVSGWTGIVAVAAGGSHSVGLKSNGTVVAVGSDASGQCDVAAWTGIQGIAAGESFTAGLRIDGTVVWTGLPFQGAAEVADWTGIVSIKAGRDTLVGLSKSGTLFVSGSASTPSAEDALASIDVSSGSLSPAFDPASDGPYRVILDYADDAVVVRATPANGFATATGDGTHALAVGDNPVDLVVTAQDGSTRTYHLVLERRPPQAESATLTIDAGRSVLTGIVPGTTVEEVAAAVTATGASIAVFTATGAPAGGKAGTGMVLRVTIGGTVYQELHLVVFGDLNGDGAVGASDLLLQKRLILGLSPLGADATRAGDVDFSGRVSASDLLLLKRHILGLSTLPTK